MFSRVYELAAHFTEKPKHVFLNPQVLVSVASAIKAAGPSKPMDPLIIGAQTLTGRDVVLYELTTSAINFCYWYGNHSYRPADVARLHQCMATAWHRAQKWGAKFINLFIAELVSSRFTMIQERRQLLLELLSPTFHFVSFADMIVQHGSCITCPTDFDGLAMELVRHFPGYGADQFLKRASLFFMMLHRRLGWFAHSIGNLPIPADYQVPKMLRAMGVLEYSAPLTQKIMDGEFIPAGSMMEVEIRAQSIIACKKLAEVGGLTTEMVDDYLWLRRKSCLDPHHLTITTDY